MNENLAIAVKLGSMRAIQRAAQSASKGSWGDISPSLAKDLGWAGVAASGAGLGTYVTDKDKERSVLGKLHHVGLPAVAAAGGMLGGRARFGHKGGALGTALGLGGVLGLRELKPKGDEVSDRAARVYATLLEMSLGATMATSAGLKGAPLRRYADRLGDDTFLKKLFQRAMPDVSGAPITDRLSKALREKLRSGPGVPVGRAVDALDAQLGSPSLGRAAQAAGGVSNVGAGDYMKALGRDMGMSLVAPVAVLPVAYTTVAHNDHLDRREVAREGSIGDKARWLLEHGALPADEEPMERFKVWRELTR